jgi:hypothetical protein
VRCASALVSDPLVLRRKILALQFIDDFVRSNGQTHVGPRISFLFKVQGYNDFPSGKIRERVLQQFHNRRSKQIEIVDVQLVLSGAPIIADNPVVRMPAPVFPAKFVKCVLKSGIQYFPDTNLFVIIVFGLHIGGLYSVLSSPISMS